MNVITQRISGIMLHVADQSIVPIGYVKRSIRGEFQIDRPKIQVVRRKQVLTPFGSETRSLLHQLMLFSSKEANSIVEKQVTLNVLRKVGAGYDLQAGCRAHEIVCQNLGS